MSDLDVVDRARLGALWDSDEWLKMVGAPRRAGGPRGWIVTSRTLRRSECVGELEAR